MSQRIPDEAVERALDAWFDNSPRPTYVTQPQNKDRMNAALEASGAVFLTDEEREAVLLALDDFKPGSLTVNAIQSALEKLS